MLDYSEKVDDAFVGRCRDVDSLSNVQKMNLRYDVAKELFNEEYSHLADELKKKADEQHDTELDEWNLILEDISSAPDVSQ